MIFVDTGVWYSLLVPKDPNHQRTAKWFDSIAQPIVTSDYVVDETLTLLLMRGERSKAIEFGSLVIVRWPQAIRSISMIHRWLYPRLRFLISVLRGHLRVPNESLHGCLRAIVHSIVAQQHRREQCRDCLFVDPSSRPPIETDYRKSRGPM